MLNKILLLVVLLILGCTHTDCHDSRGQKKYPKHWWQGIPSADKKSWEIAPDAVRPPTVVLSKRNELGILSNFAATPFFLDKKKFASVEGFWQATKYPEGPDDQRSKWADWPHTRSEVESMVAFKAKKAGDFGSRMMKAHHWEWVTYDAKKLKYKEQLKGRFYDLVVRAMQAKFDQNEKVKQVLCATGSLELVPDHSQGENPPPAWEYHKIWQMIRSQKCKL